LVVKFITISLYGLLQRRLFNLKVVWIQQPGRLLSGCCIGNRWDMDGALDGKIELSRLFNQYKGQFIPSKLISCLSNPLTNNALFKDFLWVIQLERQTNRLLIDMHTERGKSQISKAKGTLSLDAATNSKRNAAFKGTWFKR
jgi:hypothetical protein